MQKKIEESTLADVETMFAQDRERLAEEEMEKAENERIFARAEAENAKLEQKTQTKSGEERTPFQRFICKLLGIK